MISITAGSTSVSLYVYFVNDDSATSTGEPKTGLLFSDIETGGSASYVRQGGARVDFTLITLASASAAYASGGFILVDDTNMPGLYRVDVPDGAFATGADFTIIQLVAASGQNTLMRPLWVALPDFDLQAANPGINVAQWDGSAVATPTVAGVPEVDVTHQVGGLVPTPTTTGVPDVNVERWLDTLVTLSGTLPDVNVEAMDAASIASGTIAAAELTNIENEIWDALKSAHVVANSFGDFLDIEVSSRSSHADPGAPPTVAAIADGVWDEDIEAAHGTNATAGLLLRVLGAAISNRANNATLDALLGVGDTSGNDVPNQILDGDTLAELSQAIPAATPTLRAAMMLLYMALRNELDTTSALKSVKNDAGTVITKATLSDDGTTFRKAEFISGP